jgi:ubiquinone/menaquinone biosynthesis C-methylase UbiE
MPKHNLRIGRRIGDGRFADAREDRLAQDYDRRWARYLDVSMRTVLDALDPQNGTRILDVPCGTGELARLLALERPEFSVTGADLSLAMLRQAVRKLPEHRSGWVRSDIARLPFPDNHFDQVVCSSGLHDFRAPDLALRELHRVLRSDGTLVLLDWCADYLSVKLVSLWLCLSNRLFVQSYTSAACIRLLEATPFAVRSFDPFRVDRTWKLMRFVCRKA